MKFSDIDVGPEIIDDVLPSPLSRPNTCFPRILSLRNFLPSHLKHDRALHAVLGLRRGKIPYTHG